MIQSSPERSIRGLSRHMAHRVCKIEYAARVTSFEAMLFGICRNEDPNGIHFPTALARLM